MVDQSTEEFNATFSDLNRLMSTDSHGFADTENFEGDASLLKDVSDSAKVLVVGAGGLGCELVKDLALSGIKDITLVDMDTIDLTNLNRQFLFRLKDVGKYKAEVVAEFIQRRCPWVKVTWHKDMIQKFDDDFFNSFQVIINGLDNIEARRWVNCKIVGLCTDRAAPATMLIDGGTEGFQGQARLIIPYKTACYECTMKLLPPQVGFAMCTVAAIPRRPEHCIAYAMMIAWPDTFKDKPLDKDSPEDMNWLCERAKVRAEEFGIKGIDYKLTMGVVKNIIPAIASTNALVSAACINECMKVLSGYNFTVDNYMQFLGQTRTSCNAMPHEMDPNCLVCGAAEIFMEAESSEKLSEFIVRVCEKLDVKEPSIKPDDNDYLCA